jgi:hypothetical protein
VKLIRSIIFEALLIVSLISVMRAFGAGDSWITATVEPLESDILLHQPLDLVVTLENSGPQLAVVDLGDDRKGNISLTITFPDGTKKTYRVPQHEGLARIGRIKIDPGQSYSQHLIVDDWVKLTKVGRYQIEVQLNGSIHLEVGADVSLNALTVVAEVREADNRALMTFCDGALRTLLASKSYAEAQHEAEILSDVQDPVAVPYLARAFETPYPVQSLLVAGLERIETDDSIRVLLAIAQKEPEMVPDAIKQALDRLTTRTSNSDLRLQIRKTLEGR